MHDEDNFFMFDIRVVLGLCHSGGPDGSSFPMFPTGRKQRGDGGEGTSAVQGCEQ
jgi:hypothetical protein